MSRKNGATIEEIMKAMGWQRHAVRRFPKSSRPFLPLGALLALVAFLLDFDFAGGALRRTCATVGLRSGFRLGGCGGRLQGFRFGLRGLAPDPGCAPKFAWPKCIWRFGLGELFKRYNSGQAVSGAYQAFGGPARSQLRQFLLASENIEGVCEAAASSSGGEPADCVLLINRKSRHLCFHLFRALRGRHMNHSQVLERQGFREMNLRRGLAIECADWCRLRRRKQRLAALLTHRDVEEAAKVDRCGVLIEHVWRGRVITLLTLPEPPISAG